MTLKINLLRIIKSKGNISATFLKKLEADPMFKIVMRKVYMYFKKDGRLSHATFIKDVSSLKEQQGGKPGINIMLQWGNRINPNLVVHLSDSESVSVKLIGSGAFADIYKHSDDKVKKVFKSIDNDSINRFKKNTKLFNEIIDKNSCIYSLTCPKPLEWFGSTADTEVGYIVKRMDQDLSNLKIDNNFGNLINLICDKLPHKRQNNASNFVHGDMKLQNVLLFENIPYLHDLDGVFVYSLPFKYPDSNINIEMTPIFSHPLFSFFVDKLNKKEHDAFDSKRWEVMFNIVHITTQSDIVLDFLNLLKVIINVSWQDRLRTILDESKYFDLYSLGASILFTGLIKNIEDLRTIGKSLINKAIKRQTGAGEMINLPAPLTNIQKDLYVFKGTRETLNQQITTLENTIIDKILKSKIKKDNAMEAAKYVVRLGPLDENIEVQNMYL